MPHVSVLLPVLDAADTLSRAVACITAQTLTDFELIIILNGSGPETRDLALRLAASDARINIVQLARPNLAAALNSGAHAASAGLLARMDADDECAPERLRAQAEFLTSHPAAAGAACDWEVRGPDGALLAINKPPRTSDETYWRLLLDNPFAHGGMMIRASRLLEAGGYDAKLERAQDFDLWMRLRDHGGIVTVPQTLYTHHLRTTASYSSSPEQARCAAGVLAKAWSVLPQGDRAEIATLLAGVMSDASGSRESLARVEAHLTQFGPSREAMLAYLWSLRALPSMSRRAADVAKLTHVRAVLRSLRPCGRLWLYGAGAHTRWLLDTIPEAREQVAGVVDDHAQWQSVGGFIVGAPDSVPGGSHVLISSDGAEDVLWDRAEPLRRRGIGVHRIYEAARAPESL